MPRAVAAAAAAAPPPVPPAAARRIDDFARESALDGARATFDWMWLRALLYTRRDVTGDAAVERMLARCLQRRDWWVRRVVRLLLP